MATVATQPSPHGSPAMSDASHKGFKKLLSSRRRSSQTQDDTDNAAPRTNSIDNLSLEKSPTRTSTHSSPSRDGSSKSGSSSVRNLVPGHAKRKRRRAREDELKTLAEEGSRGRAPSQTDPPPTLSRKASSLGGSSLLTDESDVEERPPIVSRDSHTGFLTASSPLIRASLVPENDAAFENNGASPSGPPSQSVPALVEPEQPDSSPSPRSPHISSPPISGSTPNLSLPGLIDKADTLLPEGRRGSMSKMRSKSPVRKFKDVFKHKSPRTSPERKPGEPVPGVNSPLSRDSTLTLDEQPDAEQTTDGTPNTGAASRATFTAIDTKTRPETPPAALMAAPMTTVTPPTPTDSRFDVPDSPNADRDDTFNRENSNIVVSPSGNMISHKRIRSAGSISHQPSKLSNSITAPLTPTIEETRTPSGNSTAANRTPSGNFFSSWMSAAQNAATTFQTLTGPNRSRAGTTTSDTPSQKTVTDTIKEESETSEPESPRKQLAVETLGTGELRLDHLMNDPNNLSNSPQKPSLAELRHDSVVERDISAAKVEDALAKRAVSAAYEKPPDATPIAEISDPISSMRQAQPFNGANDGAQTPPNGSIIDSEATSVRRKNSVRSTLAKRRSRGSSAATGQSAIGAMISSSTIALADPAKGPKLSGFSMAPKQRNRNFHQQFRSVPDDDYLIEDYSCALQKEILLAGRLYISEGHICFSSNILGWVTTLVISFEEVVNIERENTALVIPNAIAIQTLHAKHTFRSLLSREATFDLLLGIWKVSHPANFQKSIAGKEFVAEEATKEATGTGAVEEVDEAEEGSSDDSDASDDDDSAPSFVGSAGSMGGSDFAVPEIKAVSRKPSAMNASMLAPAPGAVVEPSAIGTAAPPDAAAAVDFPGPAAHAPTDCTDTATHYDIIIKDEVLPAPLGKIYSLLYGAQSGAFMRKFLVDECKSLDLALEDDKKGLSNEKKSRQYTYIKPLGGSIGPKQTKCITTEELDFFDLEKAVSVTCSTQTPDVPSGNAFLTKTRYCLTWGPGNVTRFQMNCTIEWSAKSWLKGPIEKGAKEGQTQYGESLVKYIKAAVGRPRGMTGTSKVSKTKKKGKKGKREKSEQIEEQTKKEENWGLLEPLRGPLAPFVDPVKPFVTMQAVVGVLCVMVLWMWIRGPSGSQVGLYGLKHKDRIVAYEEMWRREESELWDWLERRAGVDAVTLQAAAGKTPDARAEQKRLRKQRQQVLKGKDVEARIREEKMGEKEMEEALKVTRERLEVLEGVVEKRKEKATA